MQWVCNMRRYILAYFMLDINMYVAVRISSDRLNLFMVPSFHGGAIKYIIYMYIHIRGFENIL